MRYVIALLNIVVLVVAVVFALSNTQDMSISLWPFDVQIKAPTFAIALGTLATGLLLGGSMVWLGHLPQRFRARNMAKELVRLGDRLLEVERELEQHRAKDMQQVPHFTIPRWKFWKRVKS